MTDPKNDMDDLIASLEGESIEALGELTLDVVPTASARSRFWETLSETHRFSDLAARVATHTALDADAVNALLLAVDEPNRFEPNPIPFVSGLHFDGGPGTENAITGIVRIEPGGAFPEHTHLGRETVLVLQGSYHDLSSGEDVQRGDLVVREAGEPHALKVTSSIPLLYLVVAQVGVQIGDQVLGPDDPDA